MKTIRLTSVTIVLSAVFGLAVCNRQPTDFGNSNGMLDNTDNGNSSMNLAQCSTSVNALPFESISMDERNGLIFMREEEKLAHDVYVTLYNKWGAQVFNHISNSEQTHTNAVLMLLQRYSIPDPVGTNAVGVFTNTTLQSVYNDLIQKGNVSLAEAIKVGLLIEELDISDLQKQIAKTDNQDITLVYENLMRASRNHLRAFNQNAVTQGVTYTPQYISQQEFTSIVNSAWEKGTNAQCGNNQQGGCKRRWYSVAYLAFIKSPFR